MNKGQIVWLLVRGCGVISLLYGLRYLLLIMENLLLVANTEMQLLTFDKIFGLILSLGIQANVFGALGLYLILNGRILFNILNREGDDSDGENVV